MDSKRRQASVWTWISVGIGTGLFISLAATLGYRYIASRDGERDPRAEKVQELILEAERLLAQGRRANSSS